MSRILIVEDDADIGNLVGHYLGKAGHTTELLLSGSDVFARVRVDPRPDAVILDLMLPGMDGLEICRSLRGDPATSDIAILMLTARAEESDRIGGLELGADDYITKPFSPKELVARVAAVLRRSSRPKETAGPLRWGPIEVDLDRHVVSASGKEVRLTAKEFLLLHYFLEHRGRVLSRDRLLSDVWGYHYTGGTRTVDVHVRRLREKLPVLGDAILTVKQFGYKLLDKTS